jgi:hypothetical protein
MLDPLVRARDLDAFQQYATPAYLLCEAVHKLSNPKGGRHPFGMRKQHYIVKKSDNGGAFASRKCAEPWCVTVKPK